MLQAFLEAAWATSFVAHVPSESRPDIIHVCFGIYCPRTDDTFGGPYVDSSGERWHYFCPCENFTYNSRGDRAYGDTCKHLEAALKEFVRHHSLQD